MKLKPLICLALIAGLLLARVPLFAHHGTGVAYDIEKVVTLKGTVTEWIWANPHCGILFDVMDDKGSVEHWGAELGNPHALSMAGMSKDILKAGDKITLSGHPAKSGAPRIELQEFTTADGRTLPEKGHKGNGAKLTDEPGQ
ncbi:MAG: hypothetical protein DMG30_15060 [Acidobacteria bacterium]|nr:MAG: hypothetical protein DMG30_15060 [Acidobacteriota bacterium]